jgi:hypothetical protein
MTERRTTDTVDAREANKERNHRYAKVAGLALVAFGGATGGHFIGEALADHYSQPDHTGDHIHESRAINLTATEIER